MLALLLYGLLNGSPYGLVIGVIVAVYLARPARVWLGAAYGAIIAAALGLYINLPPLFEAASSPAGLSGEIWNGLAHLLLSAAVGALYGSVFVWLNNRMMRGQAPKP